MKKVRRFSMSKFLLFLVFLVVILLLVVVAVFKFETSAVGGNKSKIVTVDSGENFYSIASKLKYNKLIRSTEFYKVFIKFYKPSELTAGDYELNSSMSVKEIVDFLSNKNNQKMTDIRITFREGLNIRDIAKIVDDKTDVTESEFISKINDQDFIKSIQTDYWFLGDDIFNKQIYYPLEGYLFPDTYHFEKKNLSAESIIKTILDNTLKKLDIYKDSINSSNYSIHQILTLASLVEQEAVTKDDRANVASVFYNRLNKGISLGSDVTAYYAAKKSLKESLTKAELNDCNGYNTRCLTMKGLPVGPISNPGISSIEAAINPIQNDYYYFVADTNKKVYFSKNLVEHNKIIAKLKSDGLWAA